MIRKEGRKGEKKKKKTFFANRAIKLFVVLLLLFSI